MFWVIKTGMNKEKFQRGATLYFALTILSILMAIVFGVSTIVVTQLGTIKRAGDSVIAFYAADTGIERTLYEASLGASIGDSFSDDLENGSSYEAVILAPGSNGCPPVGVSIYCIKSIGVYNQNRRGIQINR
jgi:hypothetical protein